jgi:hypothetical protein
VTAEQAGNKQREQQEHDALADDKSEHHSSFGSR